MPNCKGFKKINADWSQHHPDASEDIPEDMPEPTMKAMRIAVFVDADHAHDKKTRRSVTASLCCLIQLQSCGIPRDKDPWKPLHLGVNSCFEDGYGTCHWVEACPVNAWCKD